MASTIGRTGVNVLSPVRMAEKSTHKEPMDTHGNLHVNLTEEKEGRSKILSEECFISDSKKERLPFPTSYSTQDATNLALHDAQSGLHSSKSQDLPVYSSFSPTKTSLGPKVSPRRSPRQSPMRQSTETSASIEGSSHRNYWRSVESHDSHDYSNSISRSISAVEDAVSTPTKDTHSIIASNTTNNLNNEELLAQLEVLRMQNTMLTHRIQRAQQDSHLELERERNQRQLAVTQLTQQNQQLSAQLNQSQLEAQRLLQHEKEQFLLAMKQMQQEREALDERVRKTEQLAQEEQQLVRMQKAQLQDTLVQLESEKDALLRKLKENEEIIRQLQIHQIDISANSSSSSGSNRSDSNKNTSMRDSPARRALLPFPVVFTFPYTNIGGSQATTLASLQQENLRLTNSLQQLTQQTALLHTAIDDNNTTAAYNTTQLALQLSNEKSLLELRLSTMSKEQSQMQMRLQQAEETVRTQNALAAAQLAQQKQEAEQQLLSLQEKKDDLIHKINNSKGSSKHGSFHQTPRGEMKDNPKDSASFATSTISDHDQKIMDLQLQQMTAAMEELKKQLLLSELASVERENALKEQSRREKEELKRTVQKMREEFQQERMLQEFQSMQLAGTSNGSNNNVLATVPEEAEKSSEKCRSGSSSRKNSKTSVLHTPLKSVLSMNRLKGSSTSGSPTNISTPTNVTIPGNASGSNSRRNSRFKASSPGSPSVGAKHLASHRSLFDLLTLDYNGSSGSGGTNILNTDTTIPNSTVNSTNGAGGGSGKSKLTFTPHAVHAAELGALQYQRVTSYHKITLPTTEEVDEAAGFSPFPTPKGGTQQTATSPSKFAFNLANPTTTKGKTIMDLDSDSDEDPWSSNSGKNSNNKVKRENSIRTKIKEKLKSKDAGRDAASPVPRPKQDDQGAGSHGEVKDNTIYYNPTKTTTTTNSTSSGPPAGTTTSSAENKTLSSQAHDYSTYDLDRVSGLPAPHSAAAMNDVARLKGFAQKQMNLLQSLDQAQRQPIFYAAAYGRIEAVRYLLETLPDKGLGVQFGLQWVRGDIHGDTPVHAAASSGCAECTELLLSALSAEKSVCIDTGVTSVADLRNNMQMTPAHLCSSAEALEVLFRYKADLEAQDIHLRTPLFIACAMNREVCVEYLIDCLDQAVSNMIIESVNHKNNTLVTNNNNQSSGENSTNKTICVEDKMMHKDRRGDTPLHAAACNGAVECLLLLLQHGIDPRTQNLTGLKAIDLAVRNRHKKCKDILAEYHLHYCTSSEFDSVLFLATLEGHRRIAEAAHLRNTPSITNTTTAATLTPNKGAHAVVTDSDYLPEYKIIQENPVEQGAAIAAAGGNGGKVRFENPFGISSEDVNAVDKDNAETSKALHKATQSMFSLRANKSMRLQRLGAWIAYHDTQSDSVFWYNHETCQGQWQEPSEVQAIKNNIHGHDNNNDKDIFEKTLPAKMSMRIKRHGDWIEYITESGKTFYYNDKDGSFQWEPPYPVEQAQHTHGHNNNAAKTRKNTKAASPTDELSSHPEAEQNAHYPWRAYIDPETGAVFWYNEVTFVSQWELPAEFEAEAGGGFEPNTQPSYKPTRGGKTKESLDLSNSVEMYSIDTQHQQKQDHHRTNNSTVRRSRLHSSSFDGDEHAVAVWDHENDLGI